MRVLNVIDSLAMGGAERYVSRVSVELRRHGFDVTICALEPDGPLRAVLEAAGIRVVGTSYPRRVERSNTLTLLRTVADIARIAGRYDIVHTYLYWSDVLGAFGSRLARRSRVIVSRRALHAWRHPRSKLFHGLEAASNFAATELIANSHAVLRDTLANEQFVPARRGVIYNGIDVSAIREARPPAVPPLRLLTLGALAPRKGQADALEALAHVRSAGVDAVLELVGSGPDEALLRERSRELGVDAAVQFTGELADPRPALERAHLFVLPSHQEGFSNALLEAMAAGLPVVATDVGGNAEALVDGEGGRIVEAESPAGLAQGILWLASDGDRRAAAGRANRERVEHHFTLEASAAALASWYRTT